MRVDSPPLLRLLLQVTMQQQKSLSAKNSNDGLSRRIEHCGQEGGSRRYHSGRLIMALLIILQIEAERAVIQSSQIIGRCRPCSMCRSDIFMKAKLEGTTMARFSAIHTSFVFYLTRTDTASRPLFVDCIPSWSDRRIHWLLTAGYVDSLCKDS